MPAERFYHPGTLDSTISLEGEEFHHMVHVMRLKEGEELEIINGMGALAQGKIAHLTKQKALIEVTSVHTEPLSPCQLILLQGLPRQPRLEYILEKSVELGATQIWLFPGLFSEKKELSPSQIGRAKHILISALKQCGALHLPTLRLVPSLLSWQEPLPYPSFFGDTRKEAPPFLSLLSPSSSLLFAVGPEKGFHAKEIEKMSLLGMQGAHLHKNILRTDTAALCALSLASAFLHPTS